MDNNQGMSYQELISQLKTMKDQIQKHKELVRENHLLDSQYWYICTQQNKGMLEPIKIFKEQEKT